jgi:hypothetical protein
LRKMNPPRIERIERILIYIHTTYIRHTYFGVAYCFLVVAKTSLVSGSDRDCDLDCDYDRDRDSDSDCDRDSDMHICSVLCFAPRIRVLYVTSFAPTFPQGHMHTCIRS